jgi:hypothetical protein
VKIANEHRLIAANNCPTVKAKIRWTRTGAAYGRTETFSYLLHQRLAAPDQPFSVYQDRGNSRAPRKNPIAASSSAGVALFKEMGFTPFITRSLIALY